MQIQAPGGDVAVDALLILVAGGDTVGLCQSHEVLHAAQDRLPAGGGIHARGDIEAEETDPVRSEDSRQVQGMLIEVQMGGIVSVYRDLTDGRTQALYGKAVICQPGGIVLRLGKGQVGDVLPLDIADLQMAEAVALQGIDLTAEQRAALVGKGRKLELHGHSSSKSGTSTMTPPSMADWWAQMPAAVMLPPSCSSIQGFRSSRILMTNSWTRWGWLPW